MKRKSFGPWDSLVSLFDDDELEVSETLLQVPRIIFESQNRNRFLFTWGVRRKRSVIRRSSSVASVPLMDPTCDATGPTANASSPATPLSFSPSESDDRSKRCFKTSVSCQKENEDWPKKVEGLTHGTELTKISSVERMLVALNTELKAKQQQLSMCIETETVESRLESRGQAHSQPPPPALPLFFHPSAFGSEMCGQINGLVTSVAGPGMTNYMGRGPLSIPDLNVSPEENLPGPEQNSAAAAPDLNLNIALKADNTQLKRIATAQARKRRLQIYRVKKAKGLPHTNRFLKMGVSATNMVF